MSHEDTLLKAPGRVLSTLESDGSRRWLFPRLATGKFWHARRWTAYGLIAIFTVIPYIPINAAGDPVVLMDLMHRKLHLFGLTFLPTDTVLLALLMVSFILSIFFVTALLGRVWCGWACPQTVYMEYVFRPIERLFLGRSGVGGAPKKDVAGWRRVAMYVVFAIICVHLANTFLAYFVPFRELHSWITSPPWKHPAGFAIVMVVAGGLMFDFAYWREQMCIIGCPYGRLQSVLLDRNSMIISYDKNRGEPRGKGKRVKLAVLGEEKKSALGDCVDCGLCAAVCPTGIDIRDGLQIECVACAQCIDVCNGVMDKIGLDRGLIRYSSQARMAGDKQRVVRPRVAIYSVILVGLLSLLVVMVVTKKPFDLHVQRNKGMPFVVDPNGLVENTWILKLTNRAEVRQAFSLSIKERNDIRIEQTNDEIVLGPGEVHAEPVRLITPRENYAGGRIQATLVVTGQGGATREKSVLLLGPASEGKHENR